MKIKLYLMCKQMNKVWWKFMAYHSDENELISWKFSNVIKITPMMNIYPCDENLSLWLVYILVMKIFHCDEYSSMKRNWCYEISLMWWKFIHEMKILKWKIITITNIYDCDKNFSLWWKYITVVKIHHCDENLSSWWK